MGKRSSFERHKNDAYATWDPRVLPPLLRHLSPCGFVEPCAGDGSLIDLLEGAGFRCSTAFDIDPQRYDIEVQDATGAQLPGNPVFISNPPWTRRILHAIIANLSAQGQTWLLFDSAWASTRQAAPMLTRCHKIVTIGRLKWFRDTPFDAQDDCAWYLFGPDAPAAPAFYGRA